MPYKWYHTHSECFNHRLGNGTRFHPNHKLNNTSSIKDLNVTKQNVSAQVIQGSSSRERKTNWNPWSNAAHHTGKQKIGLWYQLTLQLSRGKPYANISTFTRQPVSVSHWCVMYVMVYFDLHSSLYIHEHLTGAILRTSARLRKPVYCWAWTFSSCSAELIEKYCWNYFYSWIYFVIFEFWISAPIEKLKICKNTINFLRVTLKTEF